VLTLLGCCYGLVFVFVCVRCRWCAVCGAKWRAWRRPALCWTSTRASTSSSVPVASGCTCPSSHPLSSFASGEPLSKVVCVCRVCRVCRIRECRYGTVSLRGKRPNVPVVVFENCDAFLQRKCTAAPHPPIPSLSSSANMPCARLAGP
jgi:hypothetical protein